MRKRFTTTVGIMMVIEAVIGVSHSMAATTPQLPTLPSITVGMQLQSGASLGSGLIFLDPAQTVQTAITGPMIINNSGQVVWYYPLQAGVSAANFQVQKYEGKPVLTWWQGTTGNPAFGALAPGIGQGEDVIMNSHYQIIKVIGAIGGVQPDSHEFYLTPKGDALLTGFESVPGVNLTSVGGPANGTVVDSLVREVNVKSGKVLLNWSALAHVPITDSHALPLLGASPWDFFHVNSISLAPNGNILISSRHMWALYEINPHTGAIVWAMGGKQSAFTFGPAASFAWQHDPRFVGPNEIQLFDNEAGIPFGRVGSQSRAIWLNVDYNTHTVSLARQILQPSNQAETNSQGSAQILSNGDALVDWGSAGTFSEYDTAGNMLLEGQLPAGGPLVTLPGGPTLPNTWSEYRAFKEKWIGTPTTSPTISVTSTAGDQWSVAAAWNGATQVARWRLLAGSDRSKLKRVSGVPWSGLITNLTLSGGRASFVRVEAVDSNGHVLAESQVVGLNG